MRKKQRQHSLINSKIRKAAFIEIEPKKDKFKYNLILVISKNFRKYVQKLKITLVSWFQFVKRRSTEVDWKAISSNLSIWLLESFVEGVGINFALHILFGFKINALTILAYGLLVKQTIDLYWRLKLNGSTQTILKTNNR